MSARFYEFTRNIILVTAMTLAGCVSVPNIPLDKVQAGPIKTVVLLRISESQHFIVRDFSGLPALAGIVGGAMSGAIQAQRTQTFFQEYNRGNVKLSSLMVDDLRQNLGKEGLEISYLPDEIPKVTEGVDDYSYISTTADAILNIWFGAVGYIADGPFSADFEPWFVVNARLLTGKAKQIVYQRTFTGGFKGMIPNSIFVPCGMAYRFNTFDVLMANFGRAIQGLTECEKAVVQKIAEDLK